MDTNDISNKVKGAFDGVDFKKWSTWPTWLKVTAPTVGFLIVSQFINPILLLAGAGIAYLVVKKKKSKNQD